MNGSESGTLDLSRVGIEDFRPLVGDSFDVELGLSDPLRIVLRAVNALASRATFRETPFELIFESEGPVQLVQAMQTLRHEALGVVDLFLVPVAGDGQRVTYQAIFQ